MPVEFGGYVVAKRPVKHPPKPPRNPFVAKQVRR